MFKVLYISVIQSKCEVTLQRAIEIRKRKTKDIFWTDGLDVVVFTDIPYLFCLRTDEISNYINNGRTTTVSISMYRKILFLDRQCCNDDIQSIFYSRFTCTFRTRSNAHLSKKYFAHIDGNGHRGTLDLLTSTGTKTKFKREIR